MDGVMRMALWKNITAKPDTVTPLPFQVYLWAAFALVAAGLIDSAYLAFSHYRVHTDVLYTSFCAVSGALNCDTVSQSPYSIFMGMPLAVWGILGYGFLLVLVSSAGSSRAQKRRGWTLIFIITLLFSLLSLFLAYISRHYIKAYCIMCIVSYGINFLVLFLVWIIRRRFLESGFFYTLKQDILFFRKAKATRKILIALILALGVLMPIFFPRYWQFELPALSPDMSTGSTRDGSPWIGAESPELVITEYTDYRCFECKKNHAYLRQFVSQYPDKVRLVHRHFPMVPWVNPLVKKPVHQGSGRMALAAAYAASQGRFWQMNDLLYNIPRHTEKIDLRDLALKSGIDFKGLKRSPINRVLKNKIRQDIVKGLKLGITGTPSYEIKGKMYQGRIPVDILKTIREKDSPTQ